MGQRVIVVGAGVMGLSCAVRLARAGYTIDVLARDLPQETASARAPGMWLPPPTPRDADREDIDPRIRRFALSTLDELHQLSAIEGTGVQVLEGYLLHASPRPTPRWFQELGRDMQIEPLNNPVPGYPFGFRLCGPVVDMPVYLEYLHAQLLQAGGTVTRTALKALPRQGLVVNCTGAAARSLVPDHRVHPAVEQSVEFGGVRLQRWYRDADRGGSELRYLVPHGDRVIVGGFVRGGLWRADPNPTEGQRLVDWAHRIEPALADAEILGHHVDPRPAQSRLRVSVEHQLENGTTQSEQAPLPEDGNQDAQRPPAAGAFWAHSSPGLLCVHCYGSGERGVTLSWGCAGEVVRTLSALAPPTGDPQTAGATLPG